MGDPLHPLFIVHIRTRRVRSDITADRVAGTLRTVRVELAAHVAIGNVELGQVARALDLPVQGRLDKVGRGNGAVGNDAGIVAGFY